VGALDTAVHVWDVAATWPIVSEAGGCLQAVPDQAIFPLVPGVDYADRVYTVMVACGDEMMSSYQSFLSLKVMS
jgi:fructose-1,6-bisphosphatase/inositol monophosphatase family enzyme